MSEYMHDMVHDRMPEDMSRLWCTEDMPEKMHDLNARRYVDRMPEVCQIECTICQIECRRYADQMPEDMPDRMPNRMSEEMSERMPEDLPEENV